MELRVLKYFLMAAREENITKAAALLHVTQPTLSRQIAQLEEELGVKLFERSNHNIILTDEGMLLKRRAHEILSLEEKTRREFMQEKHLSGEISIGSGEIKGMQFLAEAIVSFRNLYPNVRFELFSGNSDSIKERIERGLLDIGLLVEPVDIGKYDFVHTNITEEWCALVQEDSPLADKEYITSSDLEKIPLIISNRELVKNHIYNWLGDYADNAEIAVNGNLLYNQAVLAKNGAGIVVTIRLDSNYDGLKYIPLNPPLRSGSVIVWKKTQNFSAATEAFIKHIKEML